MDQNSVIYIGREAIYTVVLLSAPILLGSLIVGLLISIFQASTQIQEQTLTFVPKIIAVIAILVFLGPWMMNLLISYTTNLFLNINKFIS